MASGLDNKLTGQIAEYLVCAELGHLGLLATPFAGNVPEFDLLVADRQCHSIPIQVKATRSENWPGDARNWMNIEFDKSLGRQNYLGPLQLQNPDLIYVCVMIGKREPRTSDRFFILTKADIQVASIQSYTKWMDPKDWRRPKNPESYDCRFDLSQISHFENQWGLITNRLSSIAT